MHQGKTRLLPLQTSNQRIAQFRPQAGLTEEPCRLVHHQQPGILMQQGQCIGNPHSERTTAAQLGATPEQQGQQVEQGQQHRQPAHGNGISTHRMQCKADDSVGQ